MHQNSIRLHYWGKTENFMENLKIRNTHFSRFWTKNDENNSKLYLYEVILQEPDRKYKIYAKLTLLNFDIQKI